MGMSTSRQVFGVGADRLQVGPHPLDHPLLRVLEVELGGEHLGELSERPLALALHEGLEQLAQVAEVAVDDRPGDAGLAGHGLDRDGVKAVAGCQGLGGVEQLLAPLVGG